MTADNPQQAIVEWISNPTEVHAKFRLKRGDLADASTIQFLKECNLPHFQLHAVQYKSITGIQRIEMCLVEQDTEGIWQVKESASSEIKNRYVTTEQDSNRYANRPWIKLSGTSYRQEFLFWAYGYIIDNGFDVALVRLTSKNGQVLEDTVHDRLVLFLTDQECQEPLDVELYNPSGELTGKQIYPGFSN